MNKFLKFIFLVGVFLIFVGCSKNKEESNLHMSSGDSSAHINNLIGKIKDIKKESFIVTTIKESSSTQSSDNLDIPVGTDIYVFIPFENLQKEIFGRIKENEKIRISYTNVSITNGIYTLTIVDGSQIEQENI